MPNGNPAIFLQRNSEEGAPFLMATRRAVRISHVQDAQRLVRRPGQATVEHALFLGMVIAGLMAISLYIQRGLNARYKTVVDGAVTVGGGSSQYEPYYASSESIAAVKNAVVTSYIPGGGVTRAERATQTVESGWQKNEQNLKADDEWDK